MEATFTTLLTAIMAGGPGAVVAIFIAIIVFLIWDRRRLVEDIKRKEEKIDKILSDYHNGQITITEAINSLRMILVEIKAHL